MLEPQTRATLSELLAPPSGFELSHAVGTSFTLDLETALTVPLSFASHRVSAADGSVGILDAIRRASDRVDVFAQAGELSMGARTDLVALLEPIVHPVMVRRGLFHPKVWFLEYSAGDRRTYRFVCGSRNLTADRSWDAVVRLDGDVPNEPSQADAETNAPLVRLLGALPTWSVQPIDTARVERIEALAERWATVRWECPAGMRDLRFHSLGIPGSTPPDIRGQRTLIASPFVSDDGLRMLRGGTRSDTHLISRPETLDRLAPESLDPRVHTYVLDDAASLRDEAGATGPHPRDLLTGLHAKLIVSDHAHSSRVLLGSANATDAALRRNIEVMVELTGPLSKFGVEETLQSLGSLIESYESAGGAEPEPTEEAQRRLEGYLRGLAATRLSVRMREGDPWTLEVWAAASGEQRGEAPDDFDLRWHLLTRPDLGGRGMPGTADQPHRIESIALADITPFVVLVARDAEGNERQTIALAELIDDVPTRRDAVIARQLTDRAAFVRLLMLLLELSGRELIAASGRGAAFFGTAAAGTEGTGLFESLVRAVGSGHSGLADVRRIVDYLSDSVEGPNVLPDGFADLWGAVWAAHVSLTGMGVES